MKRALIPTATITLLTALTITTTAAAQEPDVQHSTSITISPVHLLLPIVELTGERRLSDQLGLAAILGGGSVTTITTINGDEEETSFTALEIGASARYYLLGTFIHGLQLGAEATYAYIASDDVANTNVSGVGQGITLGGFLGYKIAANIGFTFEGQLGGQYLIATGTATNDETGESASTGDNTVGVLLNLNVGWSF